MREFTNEQVDLMRERLAEHEMDMLHMDDHAFFNVLIEGCDGWGKASDDDVVEQYLEIYGDYEE